MNISKVRFIQKAILIAAALWLSAPGAAQTITLRLDTVKSYKNDSVVMPVSVTNFANIGAITLYIQFDTTKLAWGRALSWNAGFGGNIPLVHHHNGVIGFSWIDVGGVTIPDGALFEIKFLHKQGNAVLTVGSASELANPNGIVLPHSASNGLIWEGLTLNPDDLAPQVCIGSSIELKPQPGGGFGPITYSWASAGFSSTQPTITVSPTVTTSYSVTATDGMDNVSITFSVGTYPNISPAAPINLTPLDSTTDIQIPSIFSWGSQSSRHTLRFLLVGYKYFPLIIAQQIKPHPNQP
jgi:hypothetical protein